MSEDSYSVINKSFFFKKNHLLIVTVSSAEQPWLDCTRALQNAFDAALTDDKSKN